jgi:hypothetical protein
MCVRIVTNPALPVCVLPTVSALTQKRHNRLEQRERLLVQKIQKHEVRPFAPRMKGRNVARSRLFDGLMNARARLFDGLNCARAQLFDGSKCTSTIDGTISIFEHNTPPQNLAAAAFFFKSPDDETCHLLKTTMY